MVPGARLVFLSVLIGLLSPLSSEAQRVLAVVDNEPFPEEGPGDNMVFSVRRNASYAMVMAFNRGEAVTRRLEGNGTIGDEVGRTFIGPEPRAVAMARNGDYAVIANSVGNEIVVAGIDDNGQINVVSRINSGGLNPYDVAVGYNDIVVVANRDSDQINTFHLDRRGQLHPVSQAAAGIDPHVVAVSSRGLVGVANQTERSVSLYTLNRRGELTPLGPAIAMSINGSNPPASMTPRTLDWSGRNLFVALDAPGANEDVIRAFHLRRDGVVEFRGDTTAGFFLTDIDATAAGVFAVTVNINDPTNRADDADEVRFYRREGTSLTLASAVQTPGAPPSFKQIYAQRGIRGVWQVLVTEFQGGWLRSLIYGGDGS